MSGAGVSLSGQLHTAIQMKSLPRPSSRQGPPRGDGGHIFAEVRKHFWNELPSIREYVIKLLINVRYMTGKVWDISYITAITPITENVPLIERTLAWDAQEQSRLADSSMMQERANHPIPEPHLHKYPANSLLYSQSAIIMKKLRVWFWPLGCQFNLQYHYCNFEVEQTAFN